MYVNHWELTPKITSCWYLTPYRLTKCSQDTSSLCWWGCGHVGTIFHIFWACKSLTNFWRKTFHIISTITGILTKPDPALDLLIVGIERFPKQYHIIVVHMLQAA